MLVQAQGQCRHGDLLAGHEVNNAYSVVVRVVFVLVVSSKVAVAIFDSQITAVNLRTACGRWTACLPVAMAIRSVSQQMAHTDKTMGGGAGSRVPAKASLGATVLSYFMETNGGS